MHEQLHCEESLNESASTGSIHYDLHIYSDEIHTGSGGLTDSTRRARRVIEVLVFPPHRLNIRRINERPNHRLHKQDALERLHFNSVKIKFTQIPVYIMLT